MSGSVTTDLMGSWGFERSESSASRLGDRLVYVVGNLVGQWVDVQLADGAWVRGILHTANSTNGGLGVVLNMASKLSRSGSDGGEISRTRPTSTLIVQPDEFVQLKASDVVFEEKLSSSSSSSAAFATDTEISGGDSSSLPGRRDFIAWKPDALGGGDVLPAKSLGNAPGAKWNQFDVNKEKFDVESSYDISQYTVPKPDNPAWAKKAAKIAATFDDRPQEEEGDDGDEEDKYGAVLTRHHGGRSGKGRGGRGGASQTKRNKKDKRREKFSSKGSGERWRPLPTKSAMSTAKASLPAPNASPSNGPPVVGDGDKASKAGKGDDGPSSTANVEPSPMSLPKAPFESKMKASAREFTPSGKFPAPPPTHVSSSPAPVMGYGMPPMYPPMTGYAPPMGIPMVGGLPVLTMPSYVMGSAPPHGGAQGGYIPHASGPPPPQGGMLGAYATPSHFAAHPPRANHKE